MTSEVVQTKTNCSDGASTTTRINCCVRIVTKDANYQPAAVFFHDNRKIRTSPGWKSPAGLFLPVGLFDFQALVSHYQQARDTCESSRHSG